MVQRLDLNISYTSKKNFFKKKEYYRNSPFTVDIPESMADTLSSGFVVKVQTGGSDDKIKVLLKKGFLYDFGRNGSGIVPDKSRLWRGDCYR